MCIGNQGLHQKAITQKSFCYAVHGFYLYASINQMENFKLITSGTTPP